MFPFEATDTHLIITYLISSLFLPAYHRASLNKSEGFHGETVTDNHQMDQIFCYDGDMRR
jgi:hypothetical protein